MIYDFRLLRMGRITLRLNQQFLTTNLLPSILIIAGIAIVYTGTIWFDFCWDDVAYIVQNPHIRDISWKNITAIVGRAFEGNYAPVHLLSYMGEYAVWGLNPKGYHVVNVLLHIFDSVFLFILIRKITTRNDVAILAALIFAVHPVQVENVAWVSEQKSLLAMAFFLPAFYLYVRDTDSKSNLFYWVSVILYGFSLLAKVSTVSLPILLIMYDFSYRKKFELRYLINKTPYFIIAGAMSLVSIFIQTSNRSMFYFQDDPFITFLTTLVIIKKYLLNLILPVNLSAYYSLLHTSLSEPVVMLSLVLTVSLVSGTIYLYRKDRQAGFWAAWFWIAILPNLNIIPLSVAMADRYLYLPMIGPAVVISIALFGPVKIWILRRFPTRVSWIYVASGILILLLFIISHTRTLIWKNDLTLWSDTVTRVQHGIPYTNLGAAYIQAGKIEEAKKYFEKSIEVMPAYSLAYQDLGRLYLQENNLGKAETYFLKVLSINPQNPFVSLMLSNIYITRGDLDHAYSIINEGLKYTPGEPSLLNLKAHVLTRKGELQEPLEIYRGLTILEPGSYSHWYNYGAVLSRMGRTQEAENALKQALMIDGNLPNAYMVLISLYEKDGRNERAIANYEKTLKEFQNNSEVLKNLSHLYIDHFPGKVDSVITFAQQAREHSPGDPNILGTLGWAYFIKGDYKRSIEYFKQALSARPEEPYYLYHLGVASIKTGDNQSGNAYLKELVKKYPDHELSKQAKKITPVN